MSANAVKAGDAYVQVSVDGLQDVKAEMDDLKSTVASGFDRSAKLQAVSAIADGFKMVGQVVQTAGAAVKFFTSNIMEGVERVSALQKTADRLGTSITFVSRIKIASVVSGMSMEEMEQSFAAFQRNMETFSQGVGESKQTFEALGISPEMLKGWGSLENQMFNIMSRLSEIPDPSQRAGAAMRIFGEQGRKLIPLVNGNVDSFKALMEMSDFLGTTLDEDAGRSLDRVRDNVRLLNEQFNSIWNTLAAEFGPELEKLTDELIVAFKTLTDVFMSTNDVGGAFDWVTSAIKPLAKMFIDLRIFTLQLQGGFMDLFEMIYDNPIGRVVFGLQSIVSGIDWEAGFEKSKEWNAETRGLLWDMQAARDGFDETFDRNRKKWNDVVERSRPATQALKDGAEDMKEAATELSRAFSGDVLGRTAEDYKKAQEMAQRTFESINTGINDLNGQMRNAPVVRGFLS